MSIEEFGYKDQLHRALTTKDLVIYGLIFMVPIAPYSVFGFVYNDAKGMVPLAYLVGLIGMFFTALSYAAMSRAFPLAGSVYTFEPDGRPLHGALITVPLFRNSQRKDHHAGFDSRPARSTFRAGFYHHNGR